MHPVPEIELGLDEQKVGDEAIAALSHCTDIFVRRGELVHVVDHSESGGGIAVAPLPPALLRERLSRCARWVEPTDDGSKPVRVPPWVVRAVAARGRWPGVQQLRAVVTQPVLRGDGTLVTRAGYDAATGAYLAPVGRPAHVPTDPDASAVRRALAELRGAADVLGVASEAAFAGWLAAVMSAQARFAIAGPVPLFAFGPPATPRALDLATATGALVHATPLEGIDLEVIARRPDAAFTALRGDAGFARIQRFAAGDVNTQARVLDTLQTDRRAQGSVWIASAEQHVLAPEVRSRVVLIETRGPAARAADTTGSGRLDRARIYKHALTVLVAHARGWSSVDADDLSFSAWTARVEDALVSVGLPRVLAATPPDDLDANDARTAIFDAIERVKEPVTVRVLLEMVRAPRNDGDRALHEAIEAREPGLLAHPRAAQRLGFLLARVAADPLGPRELVCLGSGMHGNRWVVRGRSAGT